jgi:hypothetical protein
MGNQINLYIFLLVLAASGLSWLFRQLNEAKERKRALQAEQRRKDEILRTGRDPSETAANPMQEADANQRLREIAARRQAQLRELRKKQQAGGEGSGEVTARPAPVAGGGSAGGGAGGPPVGRELWPGGPVVVAGPRGGAGPAQIPAPDRPGTNVPRQDVRPKTPKRTAAEPVSMGPVVSTKPTPAAAVKRRAEQRQAAAARQLAQQRAMQEDLSGPGTTSRSMPARVAAVAPERAKPAWTPPRTTAEWRAALIAAEVLGPPVASRSPNSMPGGVGF